MDAEILGALTAAEAGRKMRPTSPMLEELTAEKGLPQNLEAERSVLGAILLEPSSLASVFPILKEDDFFPDTHRRIYRSMSDLAQRSAEIDVLTLREELGRTGAVEKAGGAAYLSSLLDGVPDVANVEYYARIVKEKSTLRRLIRAGQRMVREGIAQEKDAQKLLGDVTGEIFDIAEDAVSGGFERIGEITRHNLDIIDEAKERSGAVSGLARHQDPLRRYHRLLVHHGILAAIEWGSGADSTVCVTTLAGESGAHRTPGGRRSAVTLSRTESGADEDAARQLRPDRAPV